LSSTAARARCSALLTDAVGGLLGREAEHLAQDEDGALVGGQVLQRGDEGELHALAALVARLGAGEAVGEPERVVGVGLHPDRLDHRHAGAGVGIGGGAVVDRQHPLGPPRDLVEAGVGRDRVEPGAQRAAALEPRQALPGPQQRVLEGVLGVVDRAQHPIGVRMQLAAVGLDEPAKRLLVARAGGRQQRPLLSCDRCRNRGHA
jgi:hypothetical protein